MNEKETMEIEKKNKKGFLIASILFVSFVILGTILYPFVVTKPKKVFTTAIDKISTLTKKNLEEEFPEKFKGIFTLKTDLTSKDENVKYVLELLNNMDLGITYQIDYPNKKMQVSMESSYNKKDLLHFDIIFQEEETYLFLKNIYSKYLKFTTIGLEDLFSTKLNKEDYEIVSKQFQSALKKSLKDRYFTKDTETITIDGKDKKVTKNSLLLNEENLNKIVEVLVSELNNEEFIKSYAQISNLSETEIKEMFQELEKNKEIHLTNAITISIYTEGRNTTFIGISIYDEENTCTLLKRNDSIYDYALETSETKIAGTLEIQKKDTSLEVKMIFDANDISGNIVLNYNYKEETNIPNIDAENVVDANLLTKEEQEEILNNFQKNEGLVELSQEFMKLFAPHLYDM